MPTASAFTFRGARDLRKSECLKTEFCDVGRPGWLVGALKGDRMHLVPAGSRAAGTGHAHCQVPAWPKATSGLGLALGHPEKGQAALGYDRSSRLGISPRLGIIPPRHKSVPPTEMN